MLAHDSHGPRISAISRLYLGYFSTISRLYLGYISRQEVHVVGKLLLGMILAPFFACARYRLGEFNQNSPSLPLATLGVNLLAAVSLLMSTYVTYLLLLAPSDRYIMHG